MSKSSGEGITSIVAPELAAGMVGFMLKPVPAEIVEAGTGLAIGVAGVLLEIVGAGMDNGLLNCPEGLIVLDVANPGVGTTGVLF